MAISNIAAKVIEDEKERRSNAIAMFRPTEQQEPFVRQFAKDGGLEYLVGGGNRCLAGCQEIYDPVLGVSRRVDQIDSDFHVWSIDPVTGKKIIAAAGEPFVKGFDDFYEVFLSNGDSMVVTKEHRWLSQDGSWVSLSSQLQQGFSRVPLASTSDTFLSGFRRDDHRSLRTTEDCRGDCCSCSHPYGEQPRFPEDICRQLLPLRADVQARNRMIGNTDGLVHESECTHACQLCGHLSIQDDQTLISGQFSEVQSQPFSLPCSQSFVVHQSGQQFAEESFQTRTSPSFEGGVLLDDFSAASIPLPSCVTKSFACKAQSVPQSQEEAVLCGRVQQQSPEFEQNRFSYITPSGVNIISYRRHSIGLVWDFEVKSTGNYECAGILSHNSGKTVVTACCVAAMCLGQPITLRDGTKVNMRPDRWKTEPLLVWIIGYDHRHIGSTLHRVLFKGNLFRVIRDQASGKWRAWDPTNPEDKDLYNITRPSPPLFRGSDILGGPNGISWENKKENQISSCQLAHDGTKIQFYASTGARPQGAALHCCWCDERLEDDRWYPELLMRLPDHRGKLVWTSWPDTHPSSALAELEKRATDQLGQETATSFAFKFKGSDNPYTASSHRDAILATMDEDTRKARDEGSLNMDRWRTYPRFSRFIHRAMGPDAESDDKLAKAIRKINGIPADWTRYMIFDPGTANPGVLFVAVPPIEFGDYVVPYDELYPHYQNAEQIAKLIRAKVEGQFFEDFIADAHACRQTPMGFSGTVGENYEKYLAQEKLTCRRHGSHFSYGDDSPLPRIMKTQGAMNIRSCGTPRLRILGCPQLCGQLEVYKWASDPKGNPMDKPDPYQKVDLAVCLEYFFSRGDCTYVKRANATPEDRRSPKSVAAAINGFFGTTPKKKDDSVYCGAGVPIR